MSSTQALKRLAKAWPVDPARPNLQFGELLKHIADTTPADRISARTIGAVKALEDGLMAKKVSFIYDHWKRRNLMPLTWLVSNIVEDDPASVLPRTLPSHDPRLRKCPSREEAILVSDSLRNLQVVAFEHLFYPLQQQVGLMYTVTIISNMPPVQSIGDATSIQWPNAVLAVMSLAPFRKGTKSVPPVPLTTPSPFSFLAWLTM